MKEPTNIFQKLIYDDRSQDRDIHHTVASRYTRRFGGGYVRINDRYNFLINEKWRVLGVVGN